MTLMKMLVYLLHSVSNMQVIINNYKKEVYISDLFDENYSLKLTGKTALHFIYEWNNHGDL
jgi:hypothetical protein